MFPLIFAAIAGMVILIVSTDQFVTGASKVAQGLRMSSVLVGAVILGCGTGLPELALAFHGSRINPLREILGTDSGESHGIGLIVFVVILVVVLSWPALFPDRLRRHSPLILFATIMFAALLRGSLDRFEGFAMLAGFVVGIAWILHADQSNDFDPFAPIIDDDYESHGAYIEAPVMTPVQVEMTRSMFGLLGTAIGAQMLARSAQAILDRGGFGEDVQGLAIVALGSVLPPVVVALQALKQHHEGLAVGNLIGSNLFHSLAIGGLVAVIKPYEKGGGFDLGVIAIVLTTGLITYLLLHTDDDMSKRQGIALLGSYVVLVLVAVP